VSESQAVREARAAYIEAIKKERYFWPATPQDKTEPQDKKEPVEQVQLAKG
jgi:hypothetical protein